MSGSFAPQTFIAEARELLADMESGLLRLEREPANAEGLHAVFRAMHTIKGSAGVFGFDLISDFAHAIEGAMADARAGRLEVTPSLVDLLLRSADAVRAMVDGLDAPDAAQLLESRRAAAAVLVAELEGMTRGVVGVPPADAQARAGNPLWHLSLRFGQGVLRQGMDPMALLRYLQTLGSIEAVETVDAMPPADAMDPESCYLGLEVSYASQANRAAVEDAFAFVREEGCITVLEPHALLADYAHLLKRCGDATGELLLRCGTLSARELAQTRGLRDAAQAADAEAGVEPTALPATKAEAHFVRVRADKLDDLVTLVGELVIASAGVRTIARRAHLAELQEPAALLEGLVEEVRDGALRLRMVPIGETFSRFERVVHDLGRELGKDVELVVRGADTELDKSMVEKLADPLLHLVRNALDHGIEAPAVRAQRGKPARARLQLQAWHDSGSVVLEVEDDGAGLDREKILARAVQRGLLQPGATVSEDGLLQLVTAPGFSTADEVTSVSGRGVGMDVVRRNVESLRGSLTLASQRGEGTRVALRLPLTMAIIDGFVVSVGRAAYVIPLEAVVECTELGAGAAEALAESSYTNLRGAVLPLLRLREVFGVEGGRARRENVVVVQCAGQRAGFVVDALHGEFQTVVKPLGKLFERLPGISGATIVGTGEVALILDVPALLQRATKAHVDGAATRPSDSVHSGLPGETAGDS